MSKFNPDQYIIKLKNKDYLQVAHRVLWFRTEQPNGSIQTDLVSVEPLIMKATILDEHGAVLATGYGSAKSNPSAVWNGREIEKAETAAIGRALAHAGYGTQFTGQDDDDDYLADSPVERNPSPQTATQSTKKDWLKDQKQLAILKTRGEQLRLEWLDEDIDKAKAEVSTDRFNSADAYADAIQQWLELNIMPS